MANNYSRWKSVTNPSVGVLTNPFVNYYEGISIIQTVVSGTHVLPALNYVGRDFRINNEITSTFDVIVSVETQVGYESFSIAPGDSAVFTSSGSNLWDQVAGEEVINNVANGILNDIGGGGSTDSQQDQFVTNIVYTDTPDSGPAVYTLGTVPSGYRVSDISISVNITFNDGVCDDIAIVSATDTLMDVDASDIAQAGNYAVELPAASIASEGVISAEFNSTPNGSGGTKGDLTIIVEYLAI